MADDSSPVLPDRKTMLFIERRLKEFKMQLGPMKRGPKRWPRKGGKGGDTTTGTAFGVTQSELTPGTITGTGAGFEFQEGGVGSAWLLSWVYASGWKLVVQPDPIDCVSGYTDITIPASSFVFIDFSGTLTPGYTVDPENSPPVATLVEDNRYREQLPGFIPNEPQGFYHDENGVQRWGETEC